LYHQTLVERLASLTSAVDASLAGAEHVMGAILSDGVATLSRQVQSVGSKEEVAAGFLLPEHVRQSRQLARGPSAMVRNLSGHRSRQSFILPANNRPARPTLGDELSPGSWYDDEPSWLDWALDMLEWPGLGFASPR
jgi:hypothetical protein